MVPTHAPNGGGRRTWGATLAKKTPPGFAPGGAFVLTGIGALTPGSSPETPGGGNDYDDGKHDYEYSGLGRHALLSPPAAVCPCRGKSESAWTAIRGCRSGPCRAPRREIH